VLERDIDQVTTDKNRKIVLYCGGGSRSALAALNLKKMGFKNPIPARRRLGRMEAELAKERE